MTKKEILLKQRNAENAPLTDYIGTDGYVWKMIENAMEEYHQAKLKLLGIADVVGRSELLKDFVEWQIQGNTPYAGMLIDEHIRAYFKSL